MSREIPRFTPSPWTEATVSASTVSGEPRMARRCPHAIWCGNVRFHFIRAKKGWAARARPALCAAMLCALFGSRSPLAERIPVRYREGTTRGFLVLRSPKDADGPDAASPKEIGTGDLTETLSGDRVDSTLTFHFKDGSLYQEVAEFSQEGNFRLLRYRLTEKGPSFKKPEEMSVDALKGLVVVHYADSHGHDKVETRHMKLPADIADGMISVLARNIP